ncbi:hypothetical protein BDFB_007641, partial [Asbolus verrucosus]
EMVPLILMTEEEILIGQKYPIKKERNRVNSVKDANLLIVGDIWIVIVKEQLENTENPWDFYCLLANTRYYATSEQLSLKKIKKNIILQKKSQMKSKNLLTISEKLVFILPPRKLLVAADF